MLDDISENSSATAQEEDVASKRSSCRRTVKKKNSNGGVELYCKAVKMAGKTWGFVTEIPNYEEVVGEILFRKIFELAPAAISMYSFGKGLLSEDQLEVPEAVFALDSFKVHAKRVVSMLEGVVGMMLGDDMSTLATALQDLGRRHVEFGVHPAHYGIVGTALLRTLEAGLGEHWTPEVRNGWAAVFKFVSTAMMSGAGEQVEITKMKRRDQERRKSAVLRLKVIKRSEGTSKLSLLSRSSRTRFQPNEQLRYAAIDPPKRPTRLGRIDDADDADDDREEEQVRKDTKSKPPRQPRRRFSDPLPLYDMSKDTKQQEASPAPPRLPRRWSERQIPEVIITSDGEEDSGASSTASTSSLSSFTEESDDSELSSS